MIRFLLYVTGWTAVGLFFSGQIYLDYTYAGIEISWAEAIFLGLSDWYTWAAISPLLMVLARRFPIGRESWGRTLLVYVPATFAVTLLKLAIYSPIVVLSGIPRVRTASMEMANIALLTTWLIAGFCQAIQHYRLSRERLNRALQLETQLARSQLDLLQAQLQPHFLFNTLHSIATLMHRDIGAAERMITRLSDLLRMALERRDRQFVPLRAELEFVRLYLEIQAVRFRDRLRVEYSISPDTPEIAVPSMILQPLVENAVIHGVEKQSSVVLVSIASALRDGQLRLIVRNRGRVVEQDDTWSAGNGIGLANTRERLEKLYGAEQNFELTRGAGGEFVVTLAIPAVQFDEQATR